MGMMWLVLTLATLVVHAAEMPEELSTAQRLKADVQQLAETIGDRSLERPEAREATRRYIEESLKASEIAVERTPYAVQIKGFDDPVRGVNLAVTFVGAELPDEYVIVGAHYDTVAGSPGADDNASGVAVLMELARRLASHPNQRTVRLIFFDLEEPPVFRTPAMGSWVKRVLAASVATTWCLCWRLMVLGFTMTHPDRRIIPLPMQKVGLVRQIS